MGGRSRTIHSEAPFDLCEYSLWITLLDHAISYSEFICLYLHLRDLRLAAINIA